MAITTKVYANMSASFEARLDGERLRRVAEAPNVDAAMKMLIDYGFSPADGTIDGFIVEQTDRFIEFINTYTPDESARRALVAPFVYNNAKLAYKSRFIEIPKDAYYRIDGASEIASGNYENCDSELTAALERLDADGENNPRVIDLSLTRAMYRYALGCRQKSVRDYFRTEIDLKNILAAARMKKAGSVRDEFLDGGRLKRQTLIMAIEDESFSEAFSGAYRELAETAERKDFSQLWRFERDADDYLFYMTDDVCKNMAAFKPFLNFYTRARIELKAIKTALVCVKTDSRELFLERVPKIFG